MKVDREADAFLALGTAKLHNHEGNVVFFYLGKAIVLALLEIAASIRSVGWGR